MLEKVADEVEIVVVISALDLANNKVRADLGIPYESDVLRLIDEFRSCGLYVGSVVISHAHRGEPAGSQLSSASWSGWASRSTGISRSRATPTMSRSSSVTTATDAT